MPRLCTLPWTRFEMLIFGGGRFRILRFWNNEVDQNLEGVLETIDRELRKYFPHPVGFADHPPPMGEG
jgi:hypothetical protein